MDLDITPEAKELVEKINYHADLSWAAMITDCTLQGYRWDDVSDNKKYRYAFNSGARFGAEWLQDENCQGDKHLNDEKLNEYQKACVTKIKQLWMVRIRPGQWQSVFGVNASTCKALAKKGYGFLEITDGQGYTYGLNPSF